MGFNIREMERSYTLLPAFIEAGKHLVESPPTGPTGYDVLVCVGGVVVAGLALLVNRAMKHPNKMYEDNHQTGSLTNKEDREKMSRNRRAHKEAVDGEYVILTRDDIRWYSELAGLEPGIYVKTRSKKDATEVLKTLVEQHHLYWPEGKKQIIPDSEGGISGMKGDFPYGWVTNDNGKGYKVHDKWSRDSDLRPRFQTEVGGDPKSGVNSAASFNRENFDGVSTIVTQTKRIGWGEDLLIRERTGRMSNSHDNRVLNVGDPFTVYEHQDDQNDR